MIEVAPGAGGLQAFGAKMHTKRLQDLPYHPSDSIDWWMRVMLREYCDVDLHVTRNLYERFKTQIHLREEMGAKYGIDLRSKSDAQIAESVMKEILIEPVDKPCVEVGKQFFYKAPSWAKFETPQMQVILERITTSPFAITLSGGSVASSKIDFIDWSTDQFRLVHGEWRKRPNDWVFTPIQIGNTLYKMGTGGLHSMEERVNYKTCAEYILFDMDVASYYPALILKTGIYPRQIGPRFSKEYEIWFDTRMRAKHAGNKKDANSLKIVLNGTFGKLGSPYSIFYAPDGLIQVTIGGQIALLMLIEMLELSGIPVVSANTDGIILKCPRDLEWVAMQTVQWWEGITQFTMERTDYSAIYNRDVNSYIAIGPTVGVKRKGAFSSADPGSSGWPNPTGQICVDAMIAYLTDGTPLIDTIMACKDIRQFIFVRAVRGGGSFNKHGTLKKFVSAGVTATGNKKAEQPPKKYQEQMMDKYPNHASYEALYAWSQFDVEYLGKVVRWYYKKDSTGCIQSNVGSLVATSRGCEPCMDLPDELPNDVDYARYLEITLDLLDAVGVTYGN
jgi:hypothetical protein